MSLITNRVVNTDLDEELKSLGVAPSSHLKVLSEGSDGGAFFSGELFKSKMQDEPVEVAEVDENDPIDGRFVTEELLTRIAGLDLDDLSEDDIDALLQGLSEKELPEGDEELAGFAHEIEDILIERSSRRKKRGKARAHGKSKQRTKGARRVKKITRSGRAVSVMQCRQGFHASGGKCVKSGEAHLKKGRAARRKSPAKQSKARSYRTAKRLTTQRAKDLRSKLAASTDLADELRSLSLSENTDHGDFAETIERIGRVMDLISEWIDDVAVDEVLGESFENLTTGLYENEEDFDAAVRPTLNLIKRCLEEIEDAEGN